MNPTRSIPLQSLLAKRNLWRATDLSPDNLSPNSLSHSTGLPTGSAILDRLLPDGGWPQADLVELLCNVRGIGELRLLMPVLARLSNEQPRWIAWIAPPHIPYAPALAAYGVDISRVLLIHPRTARDNLWALEQAMKTGTCSAVLGWPSDDLRHQDIRRLQAAASQGGTLGLLFRSEQVALQASPAPFRLVIRPLANPSQETGQRGATRLQVKLLKRRGGWATDFTPVEVDATNPIAQTTPDLQQQLSLWRQERRQERRQEIRQERHQERRQEIRQEGNQGHQEKRPEMCLESDQLESRPSSVEIVSQERRAQTGHSRRAPPRLPNSAPGNSQNAYTHVPN